MKFIVVLFFNSSLMLLLMLMLLMLMLMMSNVVILFLFLYMAYGASNLPPIRFSVIIDRVNEALAHQTFDASVFSQRG